MSYGNKTVDELTMIVHTLNIRRENRWKYLKWLKEEESNSPPPYASKKEALELAEKDMGDAYYEYFKCKELLERKINSHKTNNDINAIKAMGVVGLGLSIYYVASRVVNTNR